MKFPATAALAFCALSAPANAAVLAEYLFNNNANASNVLPGVTAPAASFVGGGLVYSTNNIIQGTHTLAIQFSNVDSTTAPTGAASAIDYVSFTISATGGQTLNLDSLAFSTNLNITAASAFGSVYTVQYDDLSDGAGFQVVPLSPSTQQTTAATVVRTVDLSGSEFDNLTSGITFRINITKDPSLAAADSGNSTRLDLVQFNGAVVPEPTSALLLIAGTLPAVLRRRR